RSGDDALRYRQTTELAGLLFARRRPKNSAARIDDGREPLDARLERPQKSRALGADLTKIECGIGGRRFEIAVRQVERVFGDVQTARGDETTTLEQDALSDSIVEQHQMVFRGIARPGEEV